MQEEILLPKSLVSTDFALRNPSGGNGSSGEPHHQQSTPPKPLQLSHQSYQRNSSAEFAMDSDYLGSRAAADEPTRSRPDWIRMVPGQALQKIDIDFKSLPLPLFQHQFSNDLGFEASRNKPTWTRKRPPPPPPRPRFVWNKENHKRFRDAIKHLGKDAVPKNIAKFMNIEGLTRGTVASHLQKYRDYLKNKQGSTSGKGAVSDPTPVPDQILYPNRVTSHILPSFDPAAATATNQMAAAHYGSTVNNQFNSMFYPNGVQSDSALDRLIKRYPWPARFLRQNRVLDNIMPSFVPTQQQMAAAATTTNPYFNSSFIERQTKQEPIHNVKLLNLLPTTPQQKPEDLDPVSDQTEDLESGNTNGDKTEDKLWLTL